MIKDTAYFAVKTVSVLLVVFLIVICLFFGFIYYCNLVDMEVPTLGAYQLYAVLSDSMFPVMRTDDVVFINIAIPPEQLNVGDIITFYAFESGMIITHRITAVQNTAQGFEFRTKGDFNNAEDSFVTPEDHVVGRFMFRIPNLAGFMNASVERPYVIALVVAAVIAVQVLLGWLEKKLKPDIFKNQKSDDDDEKNDNEPVTGQE